MTRCAGAGAGAGAVGTTAVVPTLAVAVCCGGTAGDVATGEATLTPPAAAGAGA